MSGLFASLGADPQAEPRRGGRERRNGPAEARGARGQLGGDPDRKREPAVERQDDSPSSASRRAPTARTSALRRSIPRERLAPSRRTNRRRRVPQSQREGEATPPRQRRQRPRRREHGGILSESACGHDSRERLPEKKRPVRTEGRTSRMEPGVELAKDETSRPEKAIRRRRRNRRRTASLARLDRVTSGRGSIAARGLRRQSRRRENGWEGGARGRGGAPAPAEAAGSGNALACVDGGSQASVAATGEATRFGTPVSVSPRKSSTPRKWGACGVHNSKERATTAARFPSGSGRIANGSLRKPPSLLPRRRAPRARRAGPGGRDPMRSREPARCSATHTERSPARRGPGTSGRRHRKG